MIYKDEGYNDEATYDYSKKTTKFSDIRWKNANLIANLKEALSESSELLAYYQSHKSPAETPDTQPY